jgi:hypothetical protein
MGASWCSWHQATHDDLGLGQPTKVLDCDPCTSSARAQMLAWRCAYGWSCAPPLLHCHCALPLLTAHSHCRMWPCALPLKMAGHAALPLSRTATATARHIPDGWSCRTLLRDAVAGNAACRQSCALPYQMAGHYETAAARCSRYQELLPGCQQDAGATMQTATEACPADSYT